MEINSQLIALIAPGGYGKTYYIQNEYLTFWQKPTLHFSFPCQASEDFFQQFFQQCKVRNIPIPEHLERLEDWLKCWNEQNTPFLIALENWHELELLSEVKSFWADIIRHLPAQLTLIISSRKQIDLPVASLCSQGKGRVLNEKDLAFSSAMAQRLWNDNQLKWETADEVFFQKARGWPLGMILYMQFRAGQINHTTFHELLSQAVEDLFQPLFKLSASQDLTPWHLAPYTWTELWKEYLFKLHRPHPQLWLHKALQEKPAQARMFLERAVNLSSEEHHHFLLTIYTRLSHNYSLLGNGEMVDSFLDRAESVLEEGLLLDQAVWHYLKANRLRQKCQHEEAIQVCQKLLQMKATDPRVLDFQTRGRIVLGLTAYQQGDYSTTQEQYEEALLLAQTDQNHQLALQIEIMLAFLFALQGRNTEESLPANIMNKISQQPLSSQPLMWLNLAFYWILGEQLDLEAGKQIIEKVKVNAKELQWPFLKPLVADIEARLWRYAKKYEQAMSCHKEALSQLEPGTFEYLNASLNRALTLKKSQHNDSELEQLYQEAQQKGALSLLQEIQSLMHTQSSQIVSMESRGSFEKPIIQIKMFGGLNVSVHEQPILKWPRKKAKLVLIQVLFHQRGIHRESLTDWLFPDADLEQGNRNLDVQLHSLRKLLEPDRKRGQEWSVIRFLDACYSFNWEYSHQWDVKEFEHGFQLWKQSLEDENIALIAAQKCLDFYQGPLLPELDFAENWIDIRESYHLKALELIQWLLDYHYHRAEWDKAEYLAEKLLEWDSCNEEGYHWLLTVTGERQDRTKLEAIYQRMIRNFKKELDIEPPQELLELLESLKG